jgi:glycosyltransferase involved in cell wall biosynthesis
MGDESNSIKVLFKLNLSSDWMGGVNYYKNLFLALSKVDNPKIIPCLDCCGEFADSFADITEKADVKFYKTWKYCVAFLFNRFFDKNYNLNEFIKRKYPSYKISSHCNKIKGTSNIQWIPDFQHLHLPEMFSKKEIKYRNREFAKIAKEADVVLLSSYNAYNDFVKFFPEYKTKGYVLHFVSYIDPKVYELTDNMRNEIFKKYNLPEKYFYLPNQFWKHKNHIVVLKALAILKKKGINDIHVICTGNTLDYRNPDYFDYLLQYIQNNDLTDNFSILGLVDYLELICLMRYSLALLQPSLFEGWSSTVEEAKSIGKNCILSNLPVHIEQNPSDSIYFNPHDAEELAAILESENRKNNLGSNVILENKARDNMEQRMIEFGLNYQKVITELVNSL